VSDEPTDFRSGVATLRRRIRVLIAAAIVGLAAGISYVMVTPPPLTSTTLVLLPTPAIADSSSSDIDTQVHIAGSASILTRAGQAVVPPLSKRSVEKMIKVSAPSNQIVQIDATSTKAAVAKTLSQAVADSYVAYVSNTAREVTQVALADLNIRKDALRTQITQLQAEIAAATKRHRAADPISHCSSTRSSTRSRPVRQGLLRTGELQSSSMRPKPPVPPPWCGCSRGHPLVPLFAPSLWSWFCSP
jgi:uncharacterized protein involved in exopolysaccharide biosynthesis